MKFIIAVLLITTLVFTRSNQQPAKVEYFKQGQILLPDMVCADTLKVVDADGLNIAMSYIEQRIIDATDYQIDSIIHTHCKPVNE